VGKSTFFKIWQLSAPLRIIGVVGAAALLALVISALWAVWNMRIDVSIGWVVLAVAVAFLGLLFPILRWLRPNTALQDYAARAVVATVAFVLTNLHLYTLDRLFIRQGRLERLLGLKRDS